MRISDWSSDVCSSDLFDKSIANEGLESRGLFYINGSDRMYLPAELRGQGLSLNLTLFAQRRFGLDLRYPDFCDRRIELPIMIAIGRASCRESVCQSV